MLVRLPDGLIPTLYTATHNSCKQHNHDFHPERSHAPRQHAHKALHLRAAGKSHGERCSYVEVDKGAACLHTWRDVKCFREHTCTMSVNTLAAIAMVSCASPHNKSEPSRAHTTSSLTYVAQSGELLQRNAAKQLWKNGLVEVGLKISEVIARS